MIFSKDFHRSGRYCFCHAAWSAFDPACDVHSLFTSLIGFDQGVECMSLRRGDKHQGSSDVRADLYVFRWVAESLSVTEMILWIGGMSSIDA